MRCALSFLLYCSLSLSRAALLVSPSPSSPPGATLPSSAPRRQDLAASFCQSAQKHENSFSFFVVSSGFFCCCFFTLMHILHPHFCCMSVCLSLQSPVGPLLPQEEVLLRQLQSELGHLESGLVQVSVGVTLSGAQVPQLPTQAFCHVVAGLETFLEQSCLGKSILIFHLRLVKEHEEKQCGRICQKKRQENI